MASPLTRRLLILYSIAFFLLFLLLYFAGKALILRGPFDPQSGWNFFAGFFIVLFCVYFSLLAFSLHMREKKMWRMAGIARRFSRRDLESMLPVEEDDATGVLAHAVNEMKNTLQQRIAEEEKEKNKLEAILKHLSEAVIGVDQDKKVRVINPAAEAIFKTSRNQAVDRKVIHVVQEMQVMEILEKAMEAGSEETAEIRMSFPEEKILRVSAIGLPQAREGICGMIVFYDVTQMRRLEKSRREFVANVSHELKTPLTSIKGYVETLLDGAIKDPKASLSFLSMMKEDVDRLTRLVENLLDLSRIEAKQSPFRSVAMDLAVEIQKAAAIVVPRIEQQQLDLKILIPEGFPRVMADRDQLKQILLNLLDNAIKFNRPGGKIEISAMREDSYANVTVSDTGMGIPEEAVDRVFERFFRVDGSRSQIQEGSGLGLSIVKHIVESHGGTVRCQSLFGQGSSFSFTLPMAI